MTNTTEIAGPESQKVNYRDGVVAFWKRYRTLTSFEPSNIDWCVEATMEVIQSQLSESQRSVERLEGERDRLRILVQRAYNEGFSEGTKEHTHFNGGKCWVESKACAALGEQ